MAISKDTERNTWTVTIKRKDGTWRKKRGFETKRAAKKWEVEELERIEHEQTTLPTFREIAELRHKHNELEVNSIKLAENAYAWFPYCDVPINEITKDMLLKWHSSFSESNLATISQNSYINRITPVFNFASEMYDIKNVSSVLKKYKESEEEVNEVMAVWNIEEFNHFIQYVHNDLYRLYFEFLFWTGCRRSEAVGLYKDCITADGKCTFKRQLRIVDGKEGLTKNRKIRTIQLDPVLMEHLKPLLEQPGKYVFGGDTPIPHSTADYNKNQAIKKSGLPYIKMHGFRHSHVSILIANHVPVMAIAQRIGDTVETVMRVYAHLLQKTEDEMNDLIANLHKS